MSSDTDLITECNMFTSKVQEDLRFGLSNNNSNVEVHGIVYHSGGSGSIVLGNPTGKGAGFNFGAVAVPPVLAGGLLLSVEVVSDPLYYSPHQITQHDLTSPLHVHCFCDCHAHRY